MTVPPSGDDDSVMRDHASGSGGAAWDRGSASYDAERSRDRVYESCLVTTRDVVETLRPRRLLDVGCGTGLATMPVCRPGRRVVGVDFSFASLRQFRAKPGAPPVCQGDVCAMPFRSGSFDVVMCTNMLQHLPPAMQVNAIRELQRVVAVEGTLVVTVHHYSEAKRRAGWIKEGRPGQPGVDYIFRFSPDELARLMGDTREVAAMGFGEWPWLPFQVQSFLSRINLGRLLAKRGYGHMLIATRRQP